MAYALYEEGQLDSPRSAKYYPQDTGYPYYQKITEIKPNSRQSSKRSKRPSTTINYVNERKCPIYVHQFHKPQNLSVLNNYSTKQSKPLVEKNTPKSKKILGFPTTKSVLDQLEETYWATWKPNKEKPGSAMSKKSRGHEDKITKIKAYGDVPENVANYLISSDFESCTISTAEESDIDRYSPKYETVINIKDARRKSTRLKTTHTQEIQTDIPLTPHQAEGHTDIEAEREKNKVKAESVEKLLEVTENASEKSSDEEVAAQETQKTEELTLLKHTDSFIINKKKQSEVKEHFQQPKCIRLYRKPGISSSFIRGGSYPLKSCLKRETSPKGNFRLGAPGSPLFVSTSSFHKKTKK